jgi:hypothetical protein
MMPHAQPHPQYHAHKKKLKHILWGFVFTIILWVCTVKLHTHYGSAIAILVSFLLIQFTAKKENIASILLQFIIPLSFAIFILIVNPFFSSIAILGILGMVIGSLSLKYKLLTKSALGLVLLLSAIAFDTFGLIEILYLNKNNYKETAIPLTEITLISQKKQHFKLENNHQPFLIQLNNNGCSYCKKQWAWLKKIQDVKGKKALYSVNVGPVNSKYDSFESFLKSKDKYEIGLFYDSSATLFKLAESNSLPVLLLVDSKGVIREIYYGWIDGYETAFIRRFLRQLEKY